MESGLQAVGVEDERLHGAVAALRWQLVVVEIDVEGAGAAHFHDDFVLGLDHSFVGSDQRGFDRGLAVGGDRDPALLGVVVAFETNGEHAGARGYVLPGD